MREVPLIITQSVGVSGDEIAMADNESGFSTCELLVVVAVMGVILAMALPQAVNSLNADTSTIAAEGVFRRRCHRRTGAMREDGLRIDQ